MRYVYEVDFISAKDLTERERRIFLREMGMAVDEGLKSVSHRLKTTMAVHTTQLDDGS